MTVLGLPLHPLIVHATVVAVPGALVEVVLVGHSGAGGAWAGTASS